MVGFRFLHLPVFVLIISLFSWTELDNGDFKGSASRISSVLKEETFSVVRRSVGNVIE